MKRKESNVNQHAINFKHNPILFNEILQNLTRGYESSENMWKTISKICFETFHKKNYKLHLFVFVGHQI
jgi:hypothetical protein